MGHAALRLPENTTANDNDRSGDPWRTLIHVMTTNGFPTVAQAARIYKLRGVSYGEFCRRMIAALREDVA